MFLGINKIPNEPKKLLNELYQGDLHMLTGNPILGDLKNYAIECVEKFSDGVDIECIHQHLDKEKFVEYVLEVKRLFTNSNVAHQLVSTFIKNLGLSASDCIYHAPRIRVIPPSSYLNAGVSYNYKAHRDTWYGGVNCQINAWMPVNNLTECQGMWLAPSYFQSKVPNSSDLYSVKNWMETERWKASKNIEAETRVHPKPVDEIPDSDRITFLGNPGDLLFFSGAQMHGSNVNTTDKIRYSVDFRFIYLPDLNAGKGAPDVDNKCGDVMGSLEDFFHIDTLEPWKNK